MTQANFKKLLEETKNSTSVSVVLANAKKVAETGNPYYICDFVEYVDLADSDMIMPILQAAIEKTKDYVHIYEFLFLTADCDKKAVNYERLVDLIIESKNPKLMAYTLEYVGDLYIDKERLLVKLVENVNAKWYDFALREVNTIDNKVLKAELLAALKIRKEMIDSGKFKEDFLKGKTPESVIRTASKSKSSYEINTVAETLTDDIEDMSVLEDAIINLGDILHIYEFGASVDGANIKKIEDAAIKSKMPKYMYYVGAYVPGANQERMYREIAKTGNKKYLEKMEEVIAESEFVDAYTDSDVPISD